MAWKTTYFSTFQNHFPRRTLIPVTIPKYSHSTCIIQDKTKRGSNSSHIHWLSSPSPESGEVGYISQGTAASSYTKAPLWWRISNGLGRTRQDTLPTVHVREQGIITRQRKTLIGCLSKCFTLTKNVAKLPTGWEDPGWIARGTWGLEASWAVFSMGTTLQPIISALSSTYVVATGKTE